MIEWILIGGIAVALYIVIYKYEKKMEKMQELIDENRDRISKNRSKIKDHHERIDTNHERLDEHYNHLEKLWVASPKPKHTHKEEVDSKE
jgi:uncharacterized coiled-coil DUF342 family protein